MLCVVIYISFMIYAWEDSVCNILYIHDYQCANKAIPTKYLNPKPLKHTEGPGFPLFPGSPGKPTAPFEKRKESGVAKIKIT